MGSLQQAVFRFSELTQELTDADLDRPWQWLDYAEGVRFAFFRNLEDLNDLAARLESQRARRLPKTVAQFLIGQYQHAYRDFQALVLGVSDERARLAPAVGEWPLQTAVQHVINAERAFLAITDYAIQRDRAQDDRPFELPDADWETYWSGDSFADSYESWSFAQFLAYYDSLHQRVLDRLSAIGDDELTVRIVFWESEPMPANFRLGRFTAHLRQHSVQVEKILVGLDFAPNEARRLLRHIYQALAGVESAALGLTDFGTAACQALAEDIERRTAEIVLALQA